MPSDENITTRGGVASFLARAVAGSSAAVRTSSAKTAMPSPGRTFFILFLPSQVDVDASLLELSREPDQDLGLLGRERLAALLAHSLDVVIEVLLLLLEIALGLSLGRLVELVTEPVLDLLLR